MNAWDTNKLRYIYAIYLDSNDYPDVLDYSSFVPRETSQIKQQMTDLAERTSALRGYL